MNCEKCKKFGKEYFTYCNNSYRESVLCEDCYCEYSKNKDVCYACKVIFTKCADFDMHKEYSEKYNKTMCSHFKIAFS